MTPDAREAAASDAPDLALGPATRLLWRSHDELHLELGTSAVVVSGLTSQLVRAVTSGHPVDELDEPTRLALRTLAEAGYLWHRSPVDVDLPAPPNPRLHGELVSLAATRGADAPLVLAARRYASVEVHGLSRLVEPIAATLAAAGVGRVRCVSDGSVRLAHATPGGLLPADEGRSRGAAAADAVPRVAPDAGTGPLPYGERPDLVVLAQDCPVPAERRDSLHADGTPHLTVRLGLDDGVVGPLVLPGLTSCLRCADLTRADRDPAWDALAAQLSIPGRYGSASGVALATTVTGVAALQALALLDGDEPATIDGTLELRLPDWRLRRRTWNVHPDCDCCDG